MAETSSLNIPTVDLADLASEDPARVERAAASLREAFGLVYLKNHGVDTQALNRYYDAFAAFIAQPAEVKKPFGRADIWYQRGWTPPNTEVAVAGNGQPDFKECYFAAPYPADEVAAMEFPEIYPANVWPENAPP